MDRYELLQAWVSLQVFCIPLIQKRITKNTWVQKAEWLFLKIVSVFMRLSEDLRLLIIWMLLPQEMYTCSQQRAPVWNHTAAGTGWTLALERQEEALWRGDGIETEDVDTVASTLVILLNVSFSQLKLNIKDDIAKKILPSVWYFSEDSGCEREVKWHQSHC